MADTIGGDLVVQGNLSAKTFTPPAGCIADNAVAAGGSTSIAGGKSPVMKCSLNNLF